MTKPRHNLPTDCISENKTIPGDIKNVRTQTASLSVADLAESKSISNDARPPVAGLDENKAIPGTAQTQIPRILIEDLVKKCVRQPVTSVRDILANNETKDCIVIVSPKKYPQSYYSPKSRAEVTTEDLTPRTPTPTSKDVKKPKKKRGNLTGPKKFFLRGP